MIQFSRLPFHYFVQEVNEIWYPGRTIINLLRYQILLTSCTKWWYTNQLKICVSSKLFHGKASLLENQVEIICS